MLNHDSLPASAETQFPQEPAMLFRFGEIIEVPEPDSDEQNPPMQWVVAGGYQGEETDTRLCWAYNYVDDGGGRKLGALGTVVYKAFGNPIATGKTVPLAGLVQMEVAKHGGDASDLNTYEWSAKDYFVIDLVEQYVADKVARGEEVSTDELQINQQRRTRLITPALQAAHEASLYGDSSIDAGPFVKVLLDTINQPH